MRQQAISASWRLNLSEMRDHIKNKDVVALQHVMGRDFGNKHKTMKKALKWAVYYGNAEAVRVLLQYTTIDQWHNAVYHAVYHDKHEIRDLISDALSAHSSGCKVDMT